MIRSEEEITDEKADQLIAGLEQSLQPQSTSRKEVAKTGVISDLFDKTILSQLEIAFANSKTGYYSLRAEEFRALIAEYIPITLVESVYRAIDVNDVGRVNYADFTNYLIASEAGNSFSARTVIAKLSFLHAQDEDSSIGIHRDAIDCLLYVRKPIPMVVSGGRDGQVGLWEPDSLMPIAFIDHRDKNAVYQEEFTRGMDTLMKAKISKNVKSHHKRVPTKMAVTSLATLFNWGLLCVGSADCAVTVYELATQDIIGRYSHMEDIPTAIECFQLTHTVSVSALGSNVGSDQPSQAQAQAQAQEETITYLAIGDGRGFLHIIVLDSDFGNGAEVGSKKKNQTSFARCIEERRYILRDVASDWITALKYIPEANALLASSRDGTVSFVDADKRAVLKVFRGHCLAVAPPASLSSSHGTTLHGHGSAQGSSSGLTGRSQSFSEHSGDARRGAPPTANPSAMQHSGYGDPAIGGVQCFDWSAFGKYVVSASERVLLFWDPFTCETMTRLDNLRSPVVAVEVHDDSNKVFCALANKLVMLLHNINFEVLQVISDPTVYRPVNLLSAMVFAPDRHTLFTAGHKLACWTLEKSAEDSEHGGAGRGAAAGVELASGRDEDLVAVLYNGLFNQVLLVKSLGTLKIYQAETGELARQFSVRPVDPLTALPLSPLTDVVTGVCLPMVTQACLDRNQTRLLVLAADLSVQFWSVTDGSPLTQVSPQLFSTSLAHIYGNCRKQVTHMMHDIVSVRVSGEAAERTRQNKLLLLGTSLGHVCGYQEVHAAIDEIPTTFLRLAEDNAPPAHAAAVLSAEDAARRRRPSHSHKAQLVGDAAAASARLQDLLRGKQTAQASTADPDAVLWMRTLPQSATLLVAYLSGRMSLWDLEHNRKLRDVAVGSMGAILNGMKRKKKPQSASRSGAATFSDHSAGFVPKVASTVTTSTASATSAASTAQRSDETSPFAASGGPRRKLHHAHSHSSSHSHNAVDEARGGSTEEDGDSDGDEQSQASSTLLAQGSLSTTATSAVAVAAPDAAKSQLSDSARKRREELEREKLAAKVSVAAHAVAASVAAQFATTLDDILHDTDRATSAEARPRSKHNASRERQAKAALQLVNGLDFSGLNAGVSERLTLVQRRAVAMQQMSQQLRRKDSALIAFRSAAPIQLKRRTQHISLLRPTAANVTATAADESPSRRRKGRRAAKGRRGEEQHDTNAPEDDDGSDDNGDDGGARSDDSQVDDDEDSDARAHRPSSGTAVAADVTEPSPRRPEAPSLSQRPSALNDGRRSLVHTARRLVVRLDGHVVSATRTAPQPIVAQLSSTVTNSATQPPTASVAPVAPVDAGAAQHVEATPEAKGSAPSVTAPLPVAPPPSTFHTPISVDCLTLLPKTRVFIGACSDRYLRFWDADSYHVLCSCLYLDVDEAASPGHRPQKLQLSPEAFGGETLRLLQSSDAEDVLVGGYDSGLLRVWSVQAYSLVTLRNLLQKHLQFQTLPSYLQPQGDSGSQAPQEFGEGMALAIAPLSLLAEWRAHDCPILSLEYVWFSYEDDRVERNTDTRDTRRPRATPPTAPAPPQLKRRRDKQSDMGQEVLDGYVLSAGLDQKVFLWSLQGRCVGEFGGYSWDINQEGSWLAARQALLSTAHGGKHALGGAKRRALQLPLPAARRAGGGLTVGASHSGGGGAADNGSGGGDADYQRDKRRLHQQLLQQFRDPTGGVRRQLLQQSFHPRQITQDSLSVRDSPSTQFLRAFCAESISGEKEHSTAEIGDYLDVLTRRMQTKAPAYAALDAQFRDVTQRHPVVEPALPRREDFRRLQKRLGIVGV